MPPHFRRYTFLGGGLFLDNVGLKVSAPPNLVAASLFNAPGGPGDWTVNLNQTVDAGGCNSNGGGGFICADGLANGGKGVSLPGPYDFVFDVTVDNGKLFTGTDDASIKARYVDGSGDKIGSIVSEPITLQVVPEPETYATMILGFAILALQIARRRT